MQITPLPLYYPWRMGELGLLELIGLVSLWANYWEISPLVRVENYLPWQTPVAILPASPNAEGQQVMQRYLKNLAAQGNNADEQGIWLQSGTEMLAENQGRLKVPAASLTKVATSLAALETWGLDHRFATEVYATGPIEQGVLLGDLVIQGSGDPTLLWEDGVTIADRLAKLGIRQVSGNLLVTRTFLIEFESDAQKNGERFKQLMQAKNWSADGSTRFQALPKTVHKPNLAIAGSVVETDTIPPGATWLLTHHSLPLSRILKFMNVYSSNFIAQSLADGFGGPPKILEIATAVGGVAPEEIQLINGSGLGTENRMAPRAVLSMFTAIERHLQIRGYSIADIFPISGTNTVGTLEKRGIPITSVVKTGTLSDVSALSGVVPTRDRGLVWFTIMNRGGDILGLRRQQDQFLSAIVLQWGSLTKRPMELTPHSTIPEAEKERDRWTETAVDLNSMTQ